MLLHDHREGCPLHQHDEVDHRRMVGHVHLVGLFDRLGPVILDHARPRGHERAAEHLHQRRLHVRAALRPEGRHEVVHRKEAGEEGHPCQEEQQRAQREHHQVAQRRAEVVHREEVPVPRPRLPPRLLEAFGERVVHDGRSRLVQRRRGVQNVQDELRAGPLGREQRRLKLSLLLVHLGRRGLQHGRPRQLVLLAQQRLRAQGAPLFHAAARPVSGERLPLRPLRPLRSCHVGSRRGSCHAARHAQRAQPHVPRAPRGRPKGDGRHSPLVRRVPAASPAAVPRRAAPRRAACRPP
mmetsp:Transcript_20365/g.63138  ORF Transcript_20365/g.63138 Transcript_20365/m.63138 type:complete len:295 (+) Transcript_20365:858-1742(+)